MGGQNLHDDYNLQEQRARRRRNDLIMRYVICVLVLVILVMALVLARMAVIPSLVKMFSSSEQASIAGLDENGMTGNTLFEAESEDMDSSDGAQDTGLVGSESQGADAVLAECENLAAMYDYDGAIEHAQDSEFYTENEELQSAVARYEAQKNSCVSWEPEDVTHIFFHTIIWDPEKAFDGDDDAEGYNQYMVTMNEFEAIMQTMYDEGYVMVSLHDMCTVNEDGTVTRKTIQLPSGKIPFVMSQDDVSYYHYMDGDGFAQKLVLDENGDVKASYREDDGSVSIGDYDLVPWIDTFVKSHPDFSYHGHKGTIALTGYEGVLGYRTDEVYGTRQEDRLTSWQISFLEDNPDFDWQADVDAATEVATAMKEEGWEFASHTWGHIDPLARGYDAMVLDTERWLENVAPIVGGTDIIIFAFGADIAGWEGYDSDNEYFQYLKSVGFDIYCNVDSNQYWVQFNGTCMRMGRRNIDGYRMYFNPDMVDDLFDVSEVWDSARPATVADLDEAAGTSVMDE